MFRGGQEWDKAKFRRLCGGIEWLSVEQLRELRAQLRGLDARIDAGREAVEACLSCGATALQRRDATGTGMRRWRCKACRRTFSSTTGTALARRRRPEKFQQVLEDMLGRVPSSCRALARRLGVDRMTVWRWRMRILSALEGIGASALAGIVEAVPRVAQGLAGMGAARTRPGALPQAGPPALAGLPSARAAAARRHLEVADPGPDRHRLRRRPPR